MRTDGQPAIYIVASTRHGTVYVGVTSDLVRRIAEHRTGAKPGFAARYGCTRLVYYELHSSMTEAITREKQVKSGSRARKIALVEQDNPHWLDLYDSIV